MNYMDVILGILLLLGILRGFFKGFFASLASLIAIVAGIYFAAHCSHFIGDAIGSSVSWSPAVVSLVAFLITFTLVLLGVSLSGKLLTKIADVAALGIFNKLLGAAFGFFKMGFICSAVLMLLGGINAHVELIKQETLDGSALYEPVQKIAPLLLPELLKKPKETPMDEEKSQSENMAQKTDSTKRELLD